MSRILTRCGIVLLFLMTATLPVFFGCGKEETGVGPDGSDLSRPVDYFVPSIGLAARFCVYSAAAESIGTSRFAIISTFTATDFSGYVAIDSVFEGIDTFWIVTNADTVFRLTPGYSYANRWPIVSGGRLCVTAPRLIFPGRSIPWGTWGRRTAILFSSTNDPSPRPWLLPTVPCTCLVAG